MPLDFTNDVSLSHAVLVVVHQSPSIVSPEAGSICAGSPTHVTNVLHLVSVCHLQPPAPLICVPLTCSCHSSFSLEAALHVYCTHCKRI